MGIKSPKESANGARLLFSRAAGAFTMLSLTETVKAVEIIEKTIEEAAYGWANQTAIRSIEAQLFSIRPGQSDGYILEKASIIDSRSQDLFSPRKAQKWGGSEQVKREILRACQSLKDRAEIIERDALRKED